MKINFIGLILIMIVTLLVGGLIGYAVNNIIGQEVSQSADSTLKQTEQILNKNDTTTNNLTETIDTSEVNIQRENSTTNTVSITPVTNEVNTNTTINNNISTANSTADTKSDVVGARTLNQNELDLFEEYLEAPGIWNFIYPEYKDLSEFDLSLFLRYYYDFSAGTEEMQKEIVGENKDWSAKFFYKYIIEDYFKKHTGKDLSVITKGNMPAYSEKYKVYYNGANDYDFMDIDVISGTEIDDKYILTYKVEKEGNLYEKNQKMELTLNKVNGEFLFVSNVKK